MDRLCLKMKQHKIHIVTLKQDENIIYRIKIKIKVKNDVTAGNYKKTKLKKT